MCIGDDKEMQDDSKTYPYVSNMSYIKHFEEKKYLLLIIF